MIVTKERCSICGEESEFCIAPDATLFREARCSCCGATLRNSDVAEEIIQYIEGKNNGLLNEKEILDNYKILNTCSTGYIHNALEECEDYFCSEYFEGIESGDYYDGILCVDLCNIPFETNTFDIVISEDVFEHIVNYEQAYKEIWRVLKPGGVHIFTIPMHEGKVTVSRRGKKKVYHGNPNPLSGNEGSLVITDWGEDIGILLEKYGYCVAVKKKHIFYSPEEITNVDDTYDEYLEKISCLEKYYRYNSTVIVTKKDNKSDYIEGYEEKDSEQYRKELTLMKEKVHKYNKIIREKNDIIRDLNDDNEKRGIHILKLDAEIVMLRNEIQQKNEEIRQLRSGQNI